MVGEEMASGTTSSDRTNAAKTDSFEPLKQLAMVPPQGSNNNNNFHKPVTSFFIRDILSFKHTRKRHNHASASSRNIVRPWDNPDSRIPKGEENSKPGQNVAGSPLDALFKMTNKTFEGLEQHGKGKDAFGLRDPLQLFSSRQPPKRRRKSRTAFTNQQIYELEKRFLYQKYLSPADRDEIAQNLGLTNAQVITWFQNRRAKLKRDMEEMKNDLTATEAIIKKGSPTGRLPSNITAIVRSVAMDSQKMCNNSHYHGHNDHLDAPRDLEMVDSTSGDSDSDNIDVEGVETDEEKETSNVASTDNNNCSLDDKEDINKGEEETTQQPSTRDN